MSFELSQEQDMEEINSLLSKFKDEGLYGLKSKLAELGDQVNDLTDKANAMNEQKDILNRQLKEQA